MPKPFIFTTIFGIVTWLGKLLTITNRLFYKIYLYNASYFKSKQNNNNIKKIISSSSVERKIFGFISQHSIMQLHINLKSIRPTNVVQHSYSLI